MKISVVMCVYNGERFIIQQLDSIKNQSLQPTEVKIYDDRSTDNSVCLINDYIKENNLQDWILTVNKQNKGWRLNFYDAIAECDGDLIFFSDHDDIWYHDKIEVMAKAMEENPDILVLSGLQHVIDAEGSIVDDINIVTCGRKFDYSVKKSSLLKNLQGINWQNRLGCAMVIRKDLQNRLKFFERKNTFAHDIWAVNTASMLDGCYYINFPAIKYRVHGNNASIPSIAEKGSKKQRKIAAINRHLDYMLYLQSGIDSDNKASISKAEYKRLNRAIKFFVKRQKIMQKPRFFCWLSLICYLGFYIKYLGIKQYAADLIDMFNLRGL